MNLVNGATYRFLNRNAEGDTGTNGKGRSLNVYGTQPTSLANVCLYTSDDNDICQQWVYVEEANGEKYLKCKGNMNLALDLYTGSSSIGGVKDFNAHVFAPSETSRIDVGSAGDGYIYIRLTYDQYRNKYLTANAGVNGTNSGKSFNSNGNIYFTDLNEGDPLPAWKPILLAAPPDPKPPVGPEPTEEVTVTNMPANVYGQKPDEEKDTEYFHPKSGMRNGTWSANGGADIEQKMRNYYYTVYKTNPVSNSQYLYNLYGAKLTGYSTYHLGVDICHGQGSPIYSAHSGEVIYINVEKGQVAIYDGTYTYYYLHMTDINVGQNETVTAGITNLGKEGDKGWADGFHLHLEIFKGRHDSGAVNPVLVNQDLPTVCPYNLI